MLTSLFGCARSSASARRMRVSANGEPRHSARAGLAARDIGLHDREHQLLQHEFQPLVGQELVVQHLDGQRVGELADARRDRLARRAERPAGERRTPPESCRAASRRRPGTRSAAPKPRRARKSAWLVTPGLRNSRWSRVRRCFSPSTSTSRSAPACLAMICGAAPRERRLAGGGLEQLQPAKTAVEDAYRACHGNSLAAAACDCLVGRTLTYAC